MTTTLAALSSKRGLAISAALLAAGIVTAFFLLRGPGTYDECILEYASKATTRDAAGLAMQSCKGMFPWKECPPAVPPPAEKAQTLSKGMKPFVWGGYAVSVPADHDCP